MVFIYLFLFLLVTARRSSSCCDDYDSNWRNLDDPMKLSDEIMAIWKQSEMDRIVATILRGRMPLTYNFLWENRTWTDGGQCRCIKGWTGPLCDQKEELEGESLGGWPHHYGLDFSSWPVGPSCGLGEVWDDIEEECFPLPPMKIFPGATYTPPIKGYHPEMHACKCANGWGGIACDEPLPLPPQEELQPCGVCKIPDDYFEDILTVEEEELGPGASLCYDHTYYPQVIDLSDEDLISYEGRQAIALMDEYMRDHRYYTAILQGEDYKFYANHMSYVDEKEEVNL